MPDSPVVSNTSPLIKLAGVGLLNLLPQVYGDIWIPAAVRAEYYMGATATDPNIDILPWLSVQHVTPEPALLSTSGLGLGESEAISLAASRQARFLILDDKRGRRVATAKGLPVVGTLSVLVRAKAMRLLPQVKPIVDQMIAQGRHIGPSVRAQILRAAGEDVT